jgi:hypothetical protein
LLGASLHRPQAHNSRKDKDMPATPHWTTKDGRRLSLCKLDDEHLANILRMGLRAVARAAQRRALDALADAYKGDGGCEYLGDVAYDDAIAKARSMPHLRSALAKSARFAPVVAEARKRGLRWNHGEPSRTH